MFYLSNFAEVSGLSPNLKKSNSFFCNCTEGPINWFDESYSISRGELPIRFLGVPSISSQLCVNDCMLMIERITSKVNIWTTIFLSFAGRIQLIKADMFSIQSL